jgi:hypothetical protein
MNTNKLACESVNQTPLALGKHKRHRGNGMRRLESRTGENGRSARHEQHALGAQMASHAKKPARETPAVTTNSHESPGRYGAGDA